MDGVDKTIDKTELLKKTIKEFSKNVLYIGVPDTASQESAQLAYALEYGSPAQGIQPTLMFQQGIADSIRSNIQTLFNGAAQAMGLHNDTEIVIENTFDEMGATILNSILEMLNDVDEDGVDELEKEITYWVEHDD